MKKERHLEIQHLSPQIPVLSEEALFSWRWQSVSLTVRNSKWIPWFPLLFLYLLNCPYMHEFSDFYPYNSLPHTNGGFSAKGCEWFRKCCLGLNHDFSMNVKTWRRKQMLESHNALWSKSFNLATMQAHFSFWIVS